MTDEDPILRIVRHIAGMVAPEIGAEYGEIPCQLICDARAALASLPPAEPPKPPRDFWREVPCGHPPDPVAWPTPDGPVCHCGCLLELSRALPEGMAEANGMAAIVPCDKCGCAVGIQWGDSKEGER